MNDGIYPAGSVCTIKRKAVSDINTKRFKRTLIYFNTDTQYANASSHSVSDFCI